MVCAPSAFVSGKLGKRYKEPLPVFKKQQRKSVNRPAAITVPELEQSKAAVLNTLASFHSRRMYEYAIERFIAWYCAVSYQPLFCS
jgi:hypothetical protein